MTYEERADRLLGMKKLDPYCPEGSIVSPLFPGVLHYGGEQMLADCVLVLMKMSGDEMTVIRGVAASGDFFRVKEWGEPLFVKRSAAGEREGLDILYMERYELIQDFIFAGNLSGEQKRILREYISVWGRLFGETLGNAAKLFCSDFFTWAEKQLA